MKVFDLRCSHGHIFEGWFVSEDEFQQQLAQGILTCPVCADTAIVKGLSAPRLNLRASALSASSSETTQADPVVGRPAVSAAAAADVSSDRLRALQAVWLQVSRELAQRTEDVGERFTEQALRMHRGEQEEKPIRGHATPEQAQELLSEGVPVLPLLLPKASTEILQ